MKKSEEANWKEKEQDIFPVEDVFSELPPPIPLDALPDPFADPDPVKEASRPEKAEGEEGEEGESSGEKKLTKSKILAIVAGVLLVGGVVTWAAITGFGRKKTEESEPSSTPTTLMFVIEDGRAVVIDGDSYYREGGYSPDEIELARIEAAIEGEDLVQRVDGITKLQLETMERVSMEAFDRECADKPDDVVVRERTPLGLCLISKGQNAPVSSVALVYQIDFDEYSGIPDDPNLYVGSSTLYWCVEFPGVFADGSILEDVYEVQQYSSCLIGEEEWEIYGFFDFANLFTYLTSQGNDVQVSGFDGHEEFAKYLADKPQFFSTIQSDSIGEDVRNSLKVEVLTELAAYQYAEVNTISEEAQFFMVYTDQEGRQCNMVIATYGVHILEKYEGEEEQLHLYYRAYGVTDVYVGAEPRKGVYWNDVESKVELSEHLSLTGFESEEALFARLYELFPDAQIWRIDMNAPRHIKEVITPPKQKS